MKSTHSSPSSDQLREAVGSQLAELCSDGRVMGRDAPLATNQRYTIGRRKVWTPERMLVHLDLLEAYRDLPDGISANGRCAVFTAGPPGAGKSGALDTRLRAPERWLRIDPDEIKKQLVESLLYEPEYQRLMADHLLADGRPVQPLELATLVHEESAMLARRAFGLALSAGVDVVLEGTLSWHKLPAEYARQLTEAGYVELQVINVETSESVAQERAKTRWWQGRIAEGEVLGGRFTPPAAVASSFMPDGSSKCTPNSEKLVELAQSQGISAELHHIDSSDAGQTESEEIA